MLRTAQIEDEEKTVCAFNNFYTVPFTSSKVQHASESTYVSINFLFFFEERKDCYNHAVLSPT